MFSGGGKYFGIFLCFFLWPWAAPLHKNHKAPVTYVGGSYIMINTR